MAAEKASPKQAAAAKPAAKPPPPPKEPTPAEDALLAELRNRLGDAVVEASVARARRLIIRIKTERLIEACKALYAAGFDHLDSISGVDWKERFEVVYFLWSYGRRALVTLKVDLPHDNPRVPTVTPVWEGANWHERETYDLFGIVFEGHPDLRRILLPQEFVGHPLRKDWKLPVEGGPQPSQGV